LRYSVPLLMLVLVLLSGCGAQQSLGNVGLPGYSVNPAPSFDTEDPFAPAGDKTVSAAFRKFFLDAVNSRSHGRWTGWSDDPQAQDAWFLSESALTAPRAWELDVVTANTVATLTSVPFTVPAGRRGIKLSFLAQFTLESGDSLFVEQSTNGGSWSSVAQFTLSNPIVGGSNKYIFFLPDAGANDEQRQIRFRFQGDATLENSSQVRVDSIAVYQTRLAPPVADSSGFNLPDAMGYWTPGAGVKPDFFDVYVRMYEESQGNDYILTQSVPYGAAWSTAGRRG